jgi:prolyl 4-hydroxylase
MTDDVVAAAFLLLLASACVLAAGAAGRRRAGAEGFRSGETDPLPYAVRLIPAVLTPDECDTLIASVSHRMTRSKVLGPDGDSESGDRTSSQAWVSVDDADPKAGAIAAKLRLVSSTLTGIRRPDMIEEVMVARYEPGQKYNHHHDACVDPEKCGVNTVYRRATLLVYLNADFEGGHTDFPRIPQTIKPERGWAVLFYDTDADTGQVIEDSLHAGLPVTSGVKYIATVWSRFQPAAGGPKG